MIKITSDSVCDLPQDILEKYDIDIMLHYVKNKYGIFQERNEITSKNIIDYVESTGEYPTTLPPSIEEYAHFFKEHSKNNDTLIHIVISKNISLSYQNAFEAAKNFSNVYVIDSTNVSMGCGAMVIKACELVKEGFCIEEILEKLFTYSNLINTSFIVHNLYYLYNTGRCPEYGYKIMKFLKCRPNLFIRDGKLTPDKYFWGKKENYSKKYIKRILKNAKNIDTDTIYIIISNNSYSFVEDIKSQIKLYHDFKNIIVAETSGTISANCGNEAFGIVYINKSN